MRTRLFGTKSAFLALSLLSQGFLVERAQAWDLTPSGTITKLYFANPSNPNSLQVNLAQGLGTCPYQMAYISQSDSNYSAFASGLISAYMAGKSVTLYITKDSTGACKIVDFSM